MLDGLHADGGSDMGLACAGTADQDDVVGLVEEVAAMQLSDQGLVDLAAGEVEAIEVAIGWEASGLRRMPARCSDCAGLPTQPIDPRAFGSIRIEWW
jgi:hypothetical protein